MNDVVVWAFPQFRRVLPVFFGIFGPRAPSVLLLELAREVLMGPRTGNDRKTAKTKAEMRYFSSSEINPHANC